LQSFDGFCEKKVLKTEQNASQQNTLATIFAPLSDCSNIALEYKFIIKA